MQVQRIRTAHNNQKNLNFKNSYEQIAESYEGNSQLTAHGSQAQSLNKNGKAKKCIRP